MVNNSILHAQRFGTISAEERGKIFACEHTAHECAMEILSGCRVHLSEDRAVAAAIVGIFSALCRVVAVGVNPDTMGTALAAMLKGEVETWRKQKETI